MNNKICKTINLIKKSYNQPLIFHALCNHLCYTMEGNNPMYEIKDEWSRILIYSVVNNNIPNQGLESKIVNILRSLKKDRTSKTTRLKIMIIVWYLKNRTIENVNHIILFELVNNFIGLSDYIDGMVISILNGVVNSLQLGLKMSKKFRNESLIQMVKKIKSYELSDACKILALPLYTQYDIEPVLLQAQYHIEPVIGQIDVQNNLEYFFLFECVCYYAKFCKKEEYVRGLMPQNDVFIDNISRYIQKEFIIETTTNKSSTDLRLEDKEIYRQVTEAYKFSLDKNKFKANLIEFISGLK